MVLRLSCTLFYIFVDHIQFPIEFRIGVCPFNKMKTDVYFIISVWHIQAQAHMDSGDTRTLAQANTIELKSLCQMELKRMNKQ